MNLAGAEGNLGFPCGSAGKESACNAGDLSSIPGFGKIPWRRERLPTPVFWPGESHGLYSPWGHKETQLSNFQFHFLTSISDLVPREEVVTMQSFNMSEETVL